MKSEQRRTIEKEFYKYEVNKRKGANYVVRKVAYDSKGADGERVKASPGNGPEDAMIRALNEDLRRYNWCKVFENTMAKFKWEQKDKLMRMRYIDKQRPDYICRALNISRSTYFYWLDEILRIAGMWAYELNLI